MNFLKTTALLTAVNYAQEVNLANGVTLKGKTCGDADDQECYKGIPYAAAPIGDNRFRPPQDYSFESTSYDATDVGFSCNQPGKDPADGYGEDCLFLNVYTPATGEDKAEQNLPVMYWIHGGCFVEGASDEYSGNDLASHGVIVVTINYRLGVFGFLGAEELRSRDTATGSTGNYGAMDAIHGLKWVRENIASFGGNPENVTIFGESAGSSLVASLLSAPTDYTTDSEGDDLFHAAILESGGFVKWSSFPMATAQNQYEGIMEKLGCTTDYYDEEVVMDCLINSSQEEVEAAFEENTEPMPCNVGCQAAPVVDGTFLPRMLSDMQSSDQVRQVPIMYGWNRHDGGVELGDQITPSEDGMTSAEYDEFWTRYTGGSTDERDQAGFGLDNYGQYGDNTAAYMATLDVITTSVYSCGVYSMIESETKDYPSVYAYEFDDSNVGEKGPESLVDHGDELSYILQEKTSDDAFYAQMRTLWTNFAKNHDPNGRVTGGAWQPSTNENLMVYEISLESGLKDWYNPAECEFWAARDNGEFLKTCRVPYW